MTEISDTPAQQLARIAELEGIIPYVDQIDLREEMRWLCALARQGVEAQSAMNTVDPNWNVDQELAKARPQSPEGTP